MFVNLTFSELDFINLILIRIDFSSLNVRIDFEVKYFVFKNLYIKGDFNIIVVI